MLEVETKFALNDRDQLVKRLADLGAVESKTEQHADTYFRHPSRDFVATKEALRVRCVDSIASVTYKGPKMDLGDSALKARKEIEWCLAPGDTDGSQMRELFTALGFTTVTTVKKQRVSYFWPDDHADYHDFTLTVDDVDQVGLYAEIELLIPGDDPEQVHAAGERIDALADRLGLTETVRSNYLSLLLNKIGE